jgi:hypothetical protein
MTGKTTFECPREHVETLERLMPDMTRALVCGWRAAEARMVEILGRIQPGFRLVLSRETRRTCEKRTSVSVWRETGARKCWMSRMAWRP